MLRFLTTVIIIILDLSLGSEPVADGENRVGECDEHDDDGPLEPVGPFQGTEVGVPDTDQLLLTTRVGHELEQKIPNQTSFGSEVLLLRHA